MAGLDGLRALAVVAVLLYHGGVSWTKGGFLGVEVFFVISGYLITLLLTAEHARRNRISVRRFWLRRARRLLPALFALLAAVMLTWTLFVRDGLHTLKIELLSALTYTTNWYLIAADSSYFTELDRPSPLKHLWSLAVEEQFYLFWPILLLVILQATRSRPRLTLYIVAGGALFSYALMQLLYDSGVDPSRVYYGTDTRASALLIGAALALCWKPRTSERVESSFTLEMAGLAGVTGVIACLGHIADQSAFLFRIGFLLCSVATAATIAAVSRPTALSRLLGIRPFAWVGTRSYGLYLWHWPVYVLTRPGADLQDWNLTRNELLALRLAITFLLAELSYRLVERPVREGALADWLVTLRGTPGAFVYHRRRVTVGAISVACAALVPVVAVLAFSKPETNEIERSLRSGEAFVEQQGDLLALTRRGATTTSVATDRQPAPRGLPRPQSASRRPAATFPVTGTTEPVATSSPATTTTPSVAPPTLPPTVPTTPAPTLPPVPRIPILAIGDSVMLGAAPELAAALGEGTWVDARVSRQFTEGIEIARAVRSAGAMGDLVVVHLGNNGSIGPNRIAEMMAELADVDRVVFLTVRVPRGWEAPNNELLFQEVARYPNALLLDWRALSEGHAEWFYGDGMHLRPDGRQAYAFWVAGAARS
jgi:peptidoglycan/LPS O-acetylase OafA/YrhL/lysophospholipase L1-like esterase